MTSPFVAKYFFHSILDKITILGIQCMRRWKRPTRATDFIHTSVCSKAMPVNTASSLPRKSNQPVPRFNHARRFRPE
jgi:hypothetical protein